jgi:hypothetical protein
MMTNGFLLSGLRRKVPYLLAVMDHTLAYAISGMGIWVGKEYEEV